MLINHSFYGNTGSIRAFTSLRVELAEEQRGQPIWRILLSSLANRINLRSTANSRNCEEWSYYSKDRYC